jgi:trans-aconitate methyltransferase
MSEEKVMTGLDGSKARLEAAGHRATILLTRDAETVEAQVAQALRGTSYDVIVVGAGLRTLPPMAEQFERLMNLLHRDAPAARLAFNSRPDDSDEAALRQL